MAGFMSTIMDTPSKVDPEQLVIGAGCNAGEPVSIMLGLEDVDFLLVFLL